MALCISGHSHALYFYFQPFARSNLVLALQRRIDRLRHGQKDPNSTVITVADSTDIVDIRVDHSISLGRMVHFTGTFW